MSHDLNPESVKYGVYQNLIQAFQDVKYDLNSRESRFRGMHEINGLAITVNRRHQVCLTFTREALVNANQNFFEQAQIISDGFISEVVGRLKRKFLTNTGKELTLQMVDENTNVEKIGLNNLARDAFGPLVRCKILMVHHRVYEFDALS